MKDDKIFLDKAYEKYGDKFTYDLSNYNGITKNKITITCPKHGEFEQVPRTFLMKNNRHGCPKCGFEASVDAKTGSFDKFIEDARQIHGDRYEYRCDNYVNRRSMITITCKEHGDFEKSAQKYLSGQHCYKCTIQELVRTNKLVGAYTEELFEEKPELKDIPAILYYMSINNGKYYKIGITTSSESKRKKDLKHKSQGAIETIDVILSYNTTLYDAFCRERDVLDKYKENRIYRSWSTELFDKNVVCLSL